MSEEYQVWCCKIIVPLDAELPNGFDAPPRTAAIKAVEDSGIEVIGCSSGWGGSLTKMEREEFNAWNTRAEAQKVGELNWKPSGKEYDRSMHSNPDHIAWAEFFMETFPNCGADEDTMASWFANAMMAKHDFDAAEAQKVEQCSLDEKPEPGVAWDIGHMADNLLLQMLDAVANSTVYRQSQLESLCRDSAALIRRLDNSCTRLGEELAKEINSPTFMGEPVISEAQKAKQEGMVSVPVEHTEAMQTAWNNEYLRCIEELVPDDTFERCYRELLKAAQGEG